MLLVVFFRLGSLGREWWGAFRRSGGKGRSARIGREEDRGVLETNVSSFLETNMATCAVLKRSVLDVNGKSFDVVLSHTSLSWGHVGIDDHRVGKVVKLFPIHFNFKQVKEIGAKQQTISLSLIIFPDGVYSNCELSDIAKLV